MENPTIQLGNNSWATKKDKLLAYNKDAQDRFQAIELDFARSSLKNVTNRSGYLSEIAVGNPAIDFLDNPSGALLLEPSSTNLIPDSNEIISLGTGIIDLNNAISLDGTQNALKITFGSGGNSGGRFSTLNSACLPNTQYTMSFYAKSLVGDGSFRVRMDYDTSLGSYENFTSTNEWVLYQYTFTTDASANNFANSSRVTSLTANNEILFYEFQLELGTVATSRIKTSGGIATRTQDTASKSGLTNYINSIEGVFYFELATLTNIFSTSESISISDSSTSNRLFFRFQNTNQLDFTSVISSSTGAFISTTLSDAKSYNKIAVYWSQSTFKLFINGVLINTDDRGLSFSANTLNRVAFDSGSGGAKLNGKVKDLRVYDTALTDQELTDLTS